MEYPISDIIPGLDLQNIIELLLAFFLLFLPIKIQKYSFTSLLNLKTIISASRVFLIGNLALVIISTIGFLASYKLNKK